MLRNTLCLLVRCPPTTTLPIWPGSALPGQWPGPWSSVVSLIPSYIVMYTSIAGISIQPTSMTGSMPFSSGGGAIGWGRTTGMVVVVVVVVVDVLLDVDVDVLVDTVEEVGAIEVRVVEVGVVEVAASSVPSATDRRRVGVGRLSVGAATPGQDDRRRVRSSTVSSTAAVRLHARRRSWPFTAIGAVILRRRRGASAGRSAIRSAWRTQAGIPIPR